jgi:hypothetical protein
MTLYTSDGWKRGRKEYFWQVTAVAGVVVTSGYAPTLAQAKEDAEEHLSTDQRCAEIRRGVWGPDKLLDGTILDCVWVEGEDVWWCEGWVDEGSGRIEWEDFNDDNDD